MSSPTELTLKGILKGHGGWVTSIATTFTRSDMILSSSRDKTVFQWNLSGKSEVPHSEEPIEYGKAHRALRGHSHYVEDVVISKDGHFALSASWDGELRLWDLNYGTTSRRFVGHKKDILCVAFSPDNRQIVSGSRDKTIRLWNTLGECKYTVDEGVGHTDWVSCVQFSPNAATPIIVSAGWDKVVKVWSVQEEFKLKKNLVSPGHTGYINSVTVSPDGSLCTSGGKDGTAMLWDLNEGRHLYSLDAGDIINSLVFSPNRYWLCAGTNQGITIWDLERKEKVFYDSKHPGCLSLAWSADGSTLFAGYTDNTIRVWYAQ